MSCERLRTAALAALLGALTACAGTPSRPPLEQIRLPPGFAIELYADGVATARGLALGERGTVFVGSKSGNVYAIPPGQDESGPHDALVIAEGLEAPHGVAFRDGALYVAERTRILRFDDIESRLESPGEAAVVYEGMPRYAHHGLRPINFGPDGHLYVAIGSPCNVCIAEEHFGRIARLDLSADPPRLETVASGVRNSVGFDWHPETGELWFTENGRDLLGDNAPPDELNRAARTGLHFGFPYCHGGTLLDPQFGLQSECSQFEPPAVNLMPHAAALGMRFYTGGQFPQDYRNTIIIAEHGSWNRAPLTGYRLTAVRTRAGAPASYEVFASGWVRGTEAWGRPVDVLVMPDGALLVSDDHAGAVYRIVYRGED